MLLLMIGINYRGGAEGEIIVPLVTGEYSFVFSVEWLSRENYRLRNVRLSPVEEASRRVERSVIVKMLKRTACCAIDLRPTVGS